MVGLLKYLKGYVKIKVWGFSPERFINLCGNKGILLWNIEKEQDVYYMCLSLEGFYRLRPIAAKTRVRVVILQRYGLPFFVPELLRRKAFLIGLAMAVAFWIISSGFIWDIELNGNFQITDDSFMSFLEEYEVKCGMRKSGLEIEELEKEIRRRFTQVTWTSARLSGTKLIIDIKENDAPIIEALPEETQGFDLSAEYDGRILSVLVRRGVPLVQAGEIVEKGSVLISGSVPAYNEDQTVKSYTYVDADADIIMEHTRTFDTELPFDYVEKKYTGRSKKRYRLRVGRKEIGWPENRPFLVYDTVIRESRPGILQKLGIPIWIDCYEHREYQNTEHVYTLDQARELLNEKLNVFLADLKEKGVQIIEKNVKIDTNGGRWILNGEFLVQESVGIRTDIIRQETGESSVDE